MFKQHAVLWSVDSFTVQVTQHLCISWLWETLPPIPGVEAEYWTPPPPGLVYLSSHNALGNKGREGRLSCLKEQQQGSFSQMDMYLLWDISSSLISHCNENDKKNSFLQRSLYSRESDTITQQISQILSFILVNVCSSECWLATYCSLLPLLSFIGFTTLLLDTSL